jgi:phage N-6-adenine-methyltransferase
LGSAIDAYSAGGGTVLMSATGASFARGKSKQIVETPPDLIAAVRRRFGAFTWDLAANRTNAKAREWLGPGGFVEDAFAISWIALPGVRWLNPPFGDIARWAEKCATTSVSEVLAGSPSRTLLLIPASVGTNYWAEHIDGKAAVKLLRPRVTFVGKTGPFPKDLALCVYGSPSGYECWKWK